MQEGVERGGLVDSDRARALRKNLKEFSKFQLTNGPDLLFWESRESGPVSAWDLVFFSWLETSRSWSVRRGSRIVLYRRRLQIFDSLVPKVFRDEDSQQTLNCALSVDLF